MNIRRIILQTSCLATNYPCNELSGNELSMRRIVLATNCPATNCPATNCPCNELSATNCPQRIVLQRIVRSPDTPIKHLQCFIAKDTSIRIMQGINSCLFELGIFNEKLL